ncbi:MAG TPA: VOC family protein [Euzebya sp.]|nr:VOC family protein [Euzebya sp.]
MPLALFKDLCIDAADPTALGGFWAAALGLHLEVHDDDQDAHLTGPTQAHTIWINRVPEPKTVKHRVHLDVHGDSVALLEALGATVIDDASFPWVVMADPEGGEFCLFLREEVPAQRLYEVVIDCADHAGASAWWHEMLGGDRVCDERGFSYIRAVPDLPCDSLDFIPVPEAKAAKNRIHLDVQGPDRQAVLAHGATLLRARDEEIGWDVMADPEGNEFCFFTVDGSPAT